MTNLPTIDKSKSEDKQLREWAKANGWKESLHKIDRDNNVETPSMPISFRKGDTHIWYCGKNEWVAAELDNTCLYVNHRYYRNLVGAFTKETK